jgi:hypothetical protein
MITAEPLPYKYGRWCYRVRLVELKLTSISQSWSPDCRRSASAVHRTIRLRLELISPCVGAAPLDGTSNQQRFILIILMPALLVLILGENIKCTLHLWLGDWRLAKVLSGCFIALSTRLSGSDKHSTAASQSRGHRPEGLDSISNTRRAGNCSSLRRSDF